MRKNSRSMILNNRLMLAIVLCMLAAFVSLILLFAAPARADEGDTVPDAPEVTEPDDTESQLPILDNVLLNATASIAQHSEVEFTVPSNWGYGTEPEILVPRAKYEGKDSDGNAYSVSFSLKLNDDQIASALSADKLIGYINKYMPAGEYELVLAYPQITTASYIEWWNGNTERETVETIYDGFDATYYFTVTPAPILVDKEGDSEDDDPVTSEEDLTVSDMAYALIKELTDVYDFSYIYDGKVHFYYDDMNFRLLELGSAIYDRGEKMEGVYWESEECDKYFGGFTLTYNLYRMLNNHYHTYEYFAGEVEDLDCELFSPCDPGQYTVYYQLAADNYAPLADVNDDGRRSYAFTVTIFGEVDIPPETTAIYTGELQKSYITDDERYYNHPYFSVDAYNGWANVGTYKITLRLREPRYYLWKGQTLENHSETTTVNFTITKAANDWVLLPDVVRWVEGEYNADENLILGEAKYGSVYFEITDADGNVVYNSDGVNTLSTLKAGYYNFTASVVGSDNYGILSYSQFIRVLEKQGLPWWGTLCIVVGALLLAALIILILYKKGVFRLLNDKIVLAIRTKATVDATIAAVRANKVAEAAKVSVAEAEKNDRAAEQQLARKAAAEQARNKPASEKMAALEAKAQAAADKAEAMRLKAEAMQARVQTMKAKLTDADNGAESGKSVDDSTGTKTE